MNSVRITYDSATEEKQVHLVVTPKVAEFFEQMFFASFGLCESFLAKQQGNAEADLYKAHMKAIRTACNVMLANGQTAVEVTELIRRMHCEVHHPGKTCREALEERGELPESDGDDSEAWKH